jgi:hypothetical protein
MKRAIRFTFLTLIALSMIQVLSPRLEAQSLTQNRDNQPREGVCFYTDANYRGESFCVNSNESLRNVGDRYNGKISSIRVFGSNGVTVYENENFNGSRQTFSQNMPQLRDWSDRITSFQVTGGRQYGGQYGGQSGVRDSSSGKPRNGACFYIDADYRGDSFCINAGESLRTMQGGFNDNISSIRVFGGAHVVAHEHKDFGGDRRAFSVDMSNLAGNFNDQITSIEVK